MAAADSELTSKIELYLRCRGLRNKDTTSLSDPFVVVYLDDVEIGRTETVRDSLDPNFATQFPLDYRFEEQQHLRFEVYDRDGSSESLADHDYVGNASTTVARVMGSRGQTCELALQKPQPKNADRGTIVIAGEEVAGSSNDVLHFKLSAHGLDRKDLFGGADPYVEIQRSREDGTFVTVWKSETVKKTTSPKWQPATARVQQLCNGDLHRPLRLRVWDWDKSSSDDFIGGCETSLSALLGGAAAPVPLINPEKKEKKRDKYRNSGTLLFEDVRLEERPSFVQFLRGGMEISVIVGIDFTGSNGHPMTPDSLHYMNPASPNEYQQAIAAVGSILVEYDHDHQVPVYGFGGRFAGEGVSHCRPLTNSFSAPYVRGVHGVMEVYNEALRTTQLSGPTVFTPLIQTAAAFAAGSASGWENRYTVLLILTDGVINDMDSTLDSIVAAADLPMSVVIVGVGKANFSGMELLDSDATALRSSRGTAASRDIVQFVPFSRFRGSPERLAKETLAEIPTQVLAYAAQHGIRPSPPPPAFGAGGPGTASGAASHTV